LDIISLIPQFGGFLYTIAAFIIALSVIVVVHEYGHYIVGQWCGIHAEVFSLGFGPVLLSRADRRGTRWQVAALPFGGYVKFLGDANAASGKGATAMQMIADDGELRNRTMHGAPLWARAATVAAGPVFNFVMSIIVFAVIFIFRGEESDPLTVGKLQNLPPAGYELQVGDEILAIDGVPTPSIADQQVWDDLARDLPVVETLDYTVHRQGERITVTGPYLFPPIIKQIVPRSAAMDIELRPGDVIQSVNGTLIHAFGQLKSTVESSDGRVLLLKVWRDGNVLDFALTPQRTDEPQADGGFVTYWRIGIVGGMAFEPATEMTSPLRAIDGAVVQTWAIISGSLSVLWHMVTGAISTCNISGPIGIAETSGAMASQGVQNFVWFIAVLSTAVGLLNLFPVPVLDGGHLVLHAYEAVTGKPPGDMAMRVLMATGISLILMLTVFALGNDIFCP